MFGLTDASIIIAYTLCFCSALLCVIYGIVNWNRDGSNNTEEKK